MFLKEVSPPTVDPVTLGELAAHLRLNHGFADNGAEDGLLSLYLHSAVRAIEKRLSQALVLRTFSLEVDCWDRAGHLVMPVGPVAEITGMELRSGGSVTPVSTASLSLRAGASRQLLSAAGGAALPPIPAGGQAALTFDAGYGPSGEDVPGELRQAVLILSAHLYEHRSGGDVRRMPGGIDALLEPHRAIRL
ncbi:MAG: hypothetical protein AAF415_02125 [Pseudomonadota bacterium]